MTIYLPLASKLMVYSLPDMLSRRVAKMDIVYSSPHLYLHEILKFICGSTRGLSTQPDESRRRHLISVPQSSVLFSSYEYIHTYRYIIETINAKH
jgi:hypothetical protein